MMTESDRKSSVGKSAPQADARDSGSRGDQFMVAAPSISLPKGGGAIRGMGEKFAANPVTGSGPMSVPIDTSPGRSGFGPQLSLSYDSGLGNGPFGFGWSLALSSITRKTDKGLPQYINAEIRSLARSQHYDNQHYV
jgi:virulence plasmid B protein